MKIELTTEDLVAIERVARANGIPPNVVLSCALARYEVLLGHIRAGDTQQWTDKSGKPIPTKVPGGGDC